MGYSAPKAEEVYRYLFRLDRGSETRLTDGFGWSILFVNDSSRLCRDFLAEYGSELCYRTADRIRFVFFSDLEPEAFRGPVEEANRGGSFLTRIISAVTRGNAHDWERDDWNMLRPTAFRPLDSQEEISRHISFESQLYTAMPGSREAHRLAQTLGIGRFVPCFLLFSDIGTPELCLFPISDTSPRQVFERLRRWVDSFYEINQTTLTQWSLIEKSIKDAVRKCQTSLSEVAAWKSGRKNQWECLQKISAYMSQLANRPPDIALVQKIKDDLAISRATKEMIWPFLDQLEASDQGEANAPKIRSWLDSIRGLTDLVLLHTRLSDFETNEGHKLPESVRTCLSTSVSQLGAIMDLPVPESELLGWWKTEFGRPLSRRRYQKYRLAWVDYSKQKYDLAAVGNVANIIKDEFTVVLQTAMAQPVDISPEESVAKVMDALAAHLNVPKDDAHWQDSISDYRQTLTDYFRNLRTRAPEWIISWGRRLSPPLCWKDCIPVSDKRGLLKATEDLPRLLAYIREIERPRQAQQNRIATNLIGTMDSWLASIDLNAADKQSVWQALVASLVSIRRDLEDDILDKLRNAANTSYPGDFISEGEVSELFRLLEEYDRAVQSIEFPFVGDSEVLRVSLDTTLLKATRLKAKEPIMPVVERVKTKLLDATKEAKKSVPHWKSVQKEARAWSPTGRLIGALKDLLAPRRMSAVFLSVGVEDESGALDQLTSRDHAVSLLDALSVQELIALENQVVGDEQESRLDTKATKQGLFNSILVAVGFLPHNNALVLPYMAADKLETLRDKVGSGAFDVFMAHNSQDKPVVLRLCQELRQQGIHPWIDVEQIAPGRWFQDVIQSAVRTVKTAAVVIGESGLGRWQLVELRAFMSRCIEHKIPLIPILLPGVATIPDDLLFLRELNYVKFKDDVTEPEGVSKLVWGITGEKPD